MNIYSPQTENKINYIKNLKKDKNLKIGFTCSAFDLVHPGHIIMLQDARSKCDFLVIGLQTDPTIDRKSKNKPIQTYEERKIMINSIKYIDYIIEYATEDDLHNILTTLSPDVRIIGSDWRGKEYTGQELDIPVYFHERNHDWSTSGFRKRIWKIENDKLKKIN